MTRWRVGKWERPASVRDVFDSGRIEWTVVRNPRPEDIAQGALGNCWCVGICVWMYGVWMYGVWMYGYGCVGA